MTHATEDANMQIGYVANGWSMGQTIGGSSSMAFTIWWNNPSATLTNTNAGVSVTEAADDAVKLVQIFKNDFTSAVVSTVQNTASGTWTVTVTATAGDWFVVRFQDSSSLSPARATNHDYTWSAPVWYDPANADVPLAINDEPPVTDTPPPTTTPSTMPTNSFTPMPTATVTSTKTPTAAPTPEPTGYIVYLPLVMRGGSWLWQAAVRWARQFEIRASR